MTRKAFKAEGKKLIAQAARHQHELTCLVLDIDHFKSVNDTLGHAAGDEVLKAVGVACRSALRAGDIIGRLGGEEFGILLPHTDKFGGAEVAEKIRQCIAAADITNHEHLSVTASLGVTSLSIVSRSMETLLAQADAAMYSAKNSGRNRCVSWHEMPGARGQEPRRRVLKSGSIQFNNRQSTIDCTIKSLGNDGAGLVVTNTAQIPAEFSLLIKGDGFETRCRVISRQNIEVAFA